jgi:hypothetical protein
MKKKKDIRNREPSTVDNFPRKDHPQLEIDLCLEMKLSMVV